MIAEALVTSNAALQPEPRGGVRVTLPTGLVGRELVTLGEFQAAHRLYVSVFGYDDASFAVNPNLLFALRDNGGSAVGIFTDTGAGSGGRASAGALVGFAYGFAGRDICGRDYHYSQSAVVDPAFQGLGVGKALKFLQREVALRWGHTRMRWTYDPALMRNGHFNLSTLGATGIGFQHEYYGRRGTDRLMVEWALRAGDDPYLHAREAASPAFTERDWYRPIDTADGLWIPAPADEAAGAGAAQRQALAELLGDALAGGRAIIHCQKIDANTAAYLAVPGIADHGRNESQEDLR